MTTSDSGSRAERLRAALDVYGDECRSYSREYEREFTIEERDTCLAILAEAEQETATAIEALRVATRERDEALAKVARYEAPGPALLVAGHSPACVAWAASHYGATLSDMLSPTNRRGWCRDWAAECSYRHDGRAYREQHARCVAVVERVAADLRVTNRDAATGAKACLAALKDGAP